LEDENTGNVTFLGYSISDLKKDIKTRKDQIEISFKIEANDAAISLLEKHLSPDDVFSRDMEKLDNLLSVKPTKLNKRVVELDEYDGEEEENEND